MSYRDRYNDSRGNFEWLPAINDHSENSNAAKSIDGWVIIVRGLHPETREQAFRESLAEYGEIKAVHMNLDKENYYCKGYAFVEYSSPKDAQAAIRGTHGRTYLGRTLSADWAFVRPPTGVTLPFGLEALEPKTSKTRAPLPIAAPPTTSHSAAAPPHAAVRAPDAWPPSVPPHGAFAYPWLLPFPGAWHMLPLMAPPYAPHFIPTPSGGRGGGRGGRGAAPPVGPALLMQAMHIAAGMGAHMHAHARAGRGRFGPDAARGRGRGAHGWSGPAGSPPWAASGDRTWVRARDGQVGGNAQAIDDAIAEVAARLGAGAPPMLAAATGAAGPPTGAHAGADADANDWIGDGVL